MADRHILLVEDSAEDAELTLHALRRNNLANRIYWARDGEEALDLACEAVKIGLENPAIRIMGVLITAGALLDR